MIFCRGALRALAEMERTEEEREHDRNLYLIYVLNLFTKLSSARNSRQIQLHYLM